MPKKLLSGTLEEQCDFLYNLALEKMEQGNFTGAVHALEEVVTHAPHYRDAAELLAEAKDRKRIQRTLIFYAIAGMAVFVALGTLLQVRNEIVFLGLAVVGSFLGWGVGNILVGVKSNH